MLYNDNPFNVLAVSPKDDRRAIARLSEEKALLIDSQKCSDARTMLTNPQRRISAEIHWFLDCSEEEVKEIDAYISNVLAGNDIDDYSWDQFCALTQLNIRLACLEAQNFRNTSMAKYYILGISRLFENIDTEVIIRLINENRRQAGFPEISKSLDIEPALGELRSEIRQTLSRRLQSLPENLYTQIVTSLSESYSGNQRYKGYAVLEDAISEYQLFINDTLHKQSQSIIKTAKFIANGAQKINVSQAVSDLIDKLREWDKLAQPLQLGALTKGSTHEESKEILIALRDLALKLHNDYGMSSESLAITNATQEVFKELPEYTDLLSSDNKTLKRLIEEKEAEDILAPVLETINKAFEALKNCPEGQRNEKINDLIKCITGANIQIKKQYSDIESSDTLRTSLGMLARSFAISLHNDYQRTEDSIRIINAIEPIFSDLPEVADKIREDKKDLNEMLQEKETTDKIIDGLKDIENSIEKVKTSYGADRNTRISALITKMVELDRLIKSAVADAETREGIRERLAYMVRALGIDLHNTKSDSENALRVISTVRNVFSDIPKLQSVFNSDISTLNTQISYQKAAAEKKRQQEEARKTKRIIWGVLGILVFILICVNSCNNSSSKSTSYSTSSYSTTPKSTATPKTTATPRPTVTPKPTPTPTPLLMPENGKVFYCSTNDRPNTFKVTNNGASNYYMKFVKAGTNTTVITFFVRAYSTAVIKMPVGNLELRYAYGSSWYGEKKLFGENTLYAKDEEYYDFNNYSWEISINASNHTGTSMDVESIGEDEF